MKLTPCATSKKVPAAAPASADADRPKSKGEPTAATPTCINFVRERLFHKHEQSLKLGNNETCRSAWRRDTPSDEEHDMAETAQGERGAGQDGNRNAAAPCRGTVSARAG